MKKILWAIDVDGTLADNSHRNHLLQDPPDWDRYFSGQLISKDSPLPTALPFFNNGKFKFGDHVILTARPDRGNVRLYTEGWLFRFNFIEPETRVLMKPDLIRFQRSSVFKPSVLEVLAAEYPDHRVILVDDHREILKACEGRFETRAAPECWETQQCWT